MPIMRHWNTCFILLLADYKKQVLLAYIASAVFTLTSPYFLILHICNYVRIFIAWPLYPCILFFLTLKKNGNATVQCADS